MKKKTRAIYPKISIRMSPYLEKQLRELAAKDRRKYSEYARMVIEDHIKAKKAKAA